MDNMFGNVQNPPVGEDGLISCSVYAEGAPVGVQLWPTLRPEQAKNFTLRSVAVVRTEARTWVVWTYENNTARPFNVGELVAAKLTPADYEKASQLCKIEV